MDDEAGEGGESAVRTLDPARSLHQLLLELFKTPPSAIQAVERDKGELARRGVLARRLAEVLGTGRDIEDVVRHLEGEPYFLWEEQSTAGTYGFPLDDSWIHAQFARNLALGNGFSYNPGVPVSGSTAPPST